MDPNSLFAKNEEWKFSKGRGFKKNIAWIPMFDIKDGYIDVFLDAKMAKDIIRMVPKIEGDFYMVSPLISDPHISRGDINEIHILNITNIFRNYSRECFFDGFQNIGFDLIGNMVRYCKKHNCMDLIKECYDEANKEVQREKYDYFKNRYIPLYRIDISEDFKSLYRQIQLSQLLL